jgi:hypothetical protein
VIEHFASKKITPTLHHMFAACLRGLIMDGGADSIEPFASYRF